MNGSWVAGIGLLVFSRKRINREEREREVLNKRALRRLRREFIVRSKFLLILFRYRLSRNGFLNFS
jgi:hypothetical protein